MTENSEPCPKSQRSAAHEHMVISSNTKFVGETQMTFSQKFFSLALAAAFFLPIAVSMMNQAAQIVA